MPKADIIEPARAGARSFYRGGIQAAGSEAKGACRQRRRDFQPDEAQSVLTDGNVRTLAHAFHAFEIAKLARVAPVHETEANDWNLNISRYGGRCRCLNCQAARSDRQAERCRAVIFEHLRRLGYV